MAWADTPYSYLAMTKESEYSDEERLEVRAGKHKYLFVYPFEKKREWYRLPAEERMRIMREHIAIGAATRRSASTPIRSASTTRSSWSRSSATSRATSSTGARAAAQRVERLHSARHADLHLYREQRPACPRRARRRGSDGDARLGELSAGRRPESFLTQPCLPDQELRVAIVGAGPAGFYAAGHCWPQTRRPGGPVRPPADAVRPGARGRRARPPKIKSVVRVYEKTAAKEVSVLRRRRAGRDLHRADLLERYRGDLCDRGGDRPAARDPRRGPAGSEAATTSWAGTTAIPTIRTTSST